MNPKTKSRLERSAAILDLAERDPKNAHLKAARTVLLREIIDLEIAIIDREVEELRLGGGTEMAR